MEVARPDLDIGVVVCNAAAAAAAGPRELCYLSSLFLCSNKIQALLQGVNIEVLVERTGREIQQLSKDLLDF